MEKAYRYIIENIENGSITKNTAVELIRLIKSETVKEKDDIAIVGIGLDMPNASTVDEFWSNLCEGIDLVTEFPDERKKDIKDYIDYSGCFDLPVDFLEGAFLDEIDKFDYNYFKLTPKEASLMDPCQRIFLQTAIKAIEDSGHDVNSFRGTNTGVYVGFASTLKDSYQKMIYDVDREAISTSIASNLPAIIPSRISYLLNLDGPSLVVDTACSSSLVAVHLASKAIQNGECEQAIVGGIKIQLMPVDVEYTKMGIESSDGITRAFDEYSTGAGIGEGSIAIILKPVSKAIRDNDQIYAVIKGSAVNQDGSSAGITAPNPIAQTKVITKAWNDAGINPENFSYIEAHGTGTKLGDPIEIEGLKKAFEKYTDRKQFCAIGSLKSNIGHLYECSGLANLVKVALSIRYRKLPKSIHFQLPNSKCNFVNTPLYVNSQCQDLQDKKEAILCGINSFGFSGTNCHVVLQEAEQVNSNLAEQKKEMYLFTLSASSEASLADLYVKYAKFIYEEKDLDLNQLCYTANVSRASLSNRTIILFNTKEELIYKLLQLAENKDSMDDNVFTGSYKIVSSNYMDIEQQKISEEFQRELTKKVGEIISGYGNNALEQLRNICRLYVQGADVPFEQLYKEEAIKRIHLPTYSFEKYRMWLTIPKLNDIYDQMYYKYTWVAVEEEKEAAGYNPVDQQVIVIHNEANSLAKDIFEEMKKASDDIFQVIIGDKFSTLSSKSFMIKNTQDDFELLFDVLELRQSFRVIYMVEEFQMDLCSIDRLKNLIRMMKAFENCGKLNFSIDIILKSSSCITGEEVIHPDNGMLFGYGLGIRKEYSGVICNEIDIEQGISAIQIIAELRRNSREACVALRGDKRYVRYLTSIGADKNEKTRKIEDGGVYVITGGLGDISLEIANDISKAKHVNFVLFSRSDLPVESEWKTVIQSGENKILISRLHKVQNIRNNGSSVEVVRCDVGCEKEVKEAIAYIIENYGKINGIIHAAGIEEGKLIADETENNMDHIVAPKILGAYYLDKYTKNEQLDFFLMFSTIATIFPAPAQAGYIAANAGMECFAAWRNQNGRKTNVIAWSTWAETGMAYRNKINVDTTFKVLSTKDALAGFYDVLVYDMPNVLIGRINTDTRFASIWNRAPFRMSRDIEYAINKMNDVRKETTILKDYRKVESEDKICNTVLLGRQDDYYTEQEKKIASVVGRLLGFPQIYVYDSLFELGVDSILMVKISKKLEEEFGVEIPISTFLENSTIEKIAAVLNSCNKNLKTENQVVINRENKYEPFKLTDVQYSYFLGRDEKYEMGNISTHAYVEIETKYDVTKLNCALNKTIKQHDMLRAVLADDGTQRILCNEKEYVLECKEIQNEEEFETYLLQERNRMSHQIFDVSKWPLFEFKVVKLKNAKTVLLVSFDMLIADAVSIQIVLRDMMEFYNDENRKIREFEYSFRDYVAAYEENKKSETYFRDKEFWEAKLEEFPSAPALPLKCDPLLVDRPHFARKQKVFNKQSWSNLKKRAAKMGVTPSALVCTAYSQVLAFWSNQERLALNLAVFNRYPFHEEVEDMVGDFTAVLLLDVELEKKKNFDERVKAVQKNLMLAFEHKSYEGIEFLRKYINLHDLNNRAAMPIVFTSMIYNAQDDSFNLLGKKTYGISQTSQIYLDCQVSDAGGELSVVWDYVEQLFEADNIEMMFDQFTKLIESCGRKEEIDKIGINEMEQNFIDNYNATEEEIEETTLSKLFHLQVNRTPNNKAIIDGEVFITYEQLDKKSNQVANYLRKEGIGAHDFVGIEAKRGIAAIIHVLGVLKAGAAYVPIDPEYGQERKDYIQENAGCKKILQADWITLEEETYSEEFLEEYAEPENEAYVIYTSGSTGNPKGVVISNKAVCNTILDINNKIALCEKDRMAGISSMCFDLSVYDIFGSLSVGGALVIVEDPRDVSELMGRIEENQVTVWNSVPSIVSMAVDVMEEGYQNQSVRQIMMSGDWIPMNLTDKIKKKFPNAKLMSLGGATEASIWSIYYPYNEIEKEWKSIPYGYPLANQKFYVLNYELDYCPLGVMGELYIGGIGVADCYQNNEEQTKNAFLNHPKLGRIYKTGDYGILKKKKEDIYIEFMGRMDNQVKIRGFRVELGEIEKCMTNLNEIEDAIVVDYKDQMGNKYLCGYYVSKEVLDSTYLKEQMAEKLPEYMVPLMLVRIEEIPLTGNGKVDRKKLIKPEILQKEKKYVAATDELEEKLIEVFEEELQIQNIGIEDDFFSLGINSILMVSIINRIGKEMHVNIKFKDIVDKNCIMELAELIRQTDKKQETTEIYFKAQHNFEHEYEPFPMTEIQNSYMIGREGIFELGNISTHGYVEFATTMDIVRMNYALNKVIERQGMLRCIFNEDGTQHILSTCPEYTINIEDMSNTDKKTQKSRFNEIREKMSHYVFDPKVWPLFEVQAIKIDEKTSFVFVGYDLMIADGASMQIVNQELLAYFRNPKLELPKLEFSFRDYMIAYKKFKEESEVYKKDREYWLNQLEEFPMSPALPLKTEASRIENVRFKRKQKIFSKDEWSKIKQKAKEMGVTSSALVCAAYCEVLGFWSNQPEFALNMTVFNRYPFHQDVDKIVGEFTSVILLAVDLTMGNSFNSRAKALQSRLFEALEHRHYEGVEFIREISKHHNLGTSAVMPIVFTSMIFDDKFDIELREDELRTQQTGISQTSQVYLDCQVSDAGGELSIITDYVEDLFKESVIDNLFEHFIGILENLIHSAEDYKLEISKEEKLLIEEYNNTTQYYESMTLHELFRKQAKNSPHNIALILGEESMTYAVLDKMSNQVARYLMEQGVERGDFIGIEASRQMSTIVNILGVLKACAVYVPVEPTYPEERRKYIIESSHAKMYLESSLYKEKHIETYEECDIESNFYPEDVAYTIYTSGSTGKPKGVVIAHNAACNTIMDMNERFQVTSEDRLIGISSMCFDLSVYDIFGTLAAGATLVMVPDQRDVRHLLEEVEKKGVTVWNSVPSIMNIAVESAIESDNENNYSWDNDTQWNSEKASEITEKGKIYWSPVKQWKIENEDIVIGNSVFQVSLFEVFVKIYSCTQDGIKFEELIELMDENHRSDAEELVKQLMKEHILVRNLLKPHEIFDGLSKMFESKYTDEIIYLSEKNKEFKYEQLNREITHGEGLEFSLLEEVTLPKGITQRRSNREFDEQSQISFEEFSQLFTTFKQSRNNDEITYYYASAGGLYPIDIYIYVKENRVEGVENGLYYYNPLRNQIELIKKNPKINDKSHYFTNKSIFNSAAFSVYMIYNASVTMPKYNSLGYLYAAIDSGIMIGTFTEVAEVHNIGLCSIGDMNFNEIEEEFGLDKNQLWIHTMEVGRRP